MDAAPFTHYLKALRMDAGKPTYRQLASSTGFSKTVVGDAFQGRRMPTWPVAEALAKALGADTEEVRKRWSASGGGATSTATIPSWLIEINAEAPSLVSGKGLPRAAQLAGRNPRDAIADGWEVIRLSGMQLSHGLYKDIPGNWSSNIVASFRRSEDDGHLPGGTMAVAQQLHSLYVETAMDQSAEPTTECALQYVVLAYRLAYLVNSIVRNATTPSNTTDSALA
ncbi:helix-turn-helix transcriptional regulator [Streptomyces sp. NPDC020719]|uniref:helix-turn-helix domain-containing protein n=1 Tax=Streptomyces sp. NPDC020719 TaxID=3154896 RepID=UPI0033ED262F